MKLRTPLREGDQVYIIDHDAHYGELHNPNELVCLKKGVIIDAEGGHSGSPINEDFKYQINCRKGVSIQRKKNIFFTFDECFLAAKKFLFQKGVKTFKGKYEKIELEFKIEEEIWVLAKSPHYNFNTDLQDDSIVRTINLYFNKDDLFKVIYIADIIVEHRLIIATSDMFRFIAKKTLKELVNDYLNEGVPNV